MKVSELEIVQRALVDAKNNGLAMEDVMAMLPPGHTDQHIMVMLYDHRFNKALWGGDKYSCTSCRKETYNLLGGYMTECCNGDYNIVWENHLTQMALSGDPVAYIAKYKYNVSVGDE